MGHKDPLSPERVKHDPLEMAAINYKEYAVPYMLLHECSICNDAVF